MGGFSPWFGRNAELVVAFDSLFRSHTMKDILEQLSKYDLATLTELFNPRYVDFLSHCRETIKYKQNELLAKFEILRKESNELQQTIKEIHRPTKDQKERPDTSMKMEQKDRRACVSSLQCSSIKFSDTTLKILSLFTSFFDPIIFQPGRLQRTGWNGVYAWAILEESFPCRAPITSLKDFLYQYSQHDNPSIDFFEDHYTIYGDGDVKSDYMYGDDKFIFEGLQHLPRLDRDDNIATFSLDKEIIKKINTARNNISKTEIKQKPSWKFSTNNGKVYYSSSFSGHHYGGIRYCTDLFTILASELLNGGFTFICYDQGKPKKILNGDYDCYVYDFGNTDEYRHNQPTGWLEMYNTTLNLTYLLPIDFLV